MDIGIWKDLEWMGGKLGWNKFMTKKYKTYEKLTLKVLSTLLVHVNPKNFPNLDIAGDLKITFQLANEPREMDLWELVKAYGIENEGMKKVSETVSNGDLHTLWEKLTGER